MYYAVTIATLVTMALALIRAVLGRSGAALDAPLGETTLGTALLAPTRIYVRPLLALFEAAGATPYAGVARGNLERATTLLDQRRASQATS